MVHRQNNEQSLKEAIQELLDAYRLNQKLHETQLIGKWEKVVGKLIASHTRSLSIRNKKLYVKTHSSVIRNELSLSKDMIIKKLNKAVGEEVIDDIILG
jgi:predicted nucleic acid-binding Zn ribbon protein